MSKNKNTGTCALCEKTNIQLRASHLIPKLAYTRTRTTKKSRFRAMNDIKQPLQDGEKKYLLCDNCEEFFSGFETQFANNFLDNFLKSKKLNKKCFKESWFQNYVLSVAWRIMYDDLYNAGSFTDESCRSVFEEYENSVRKYFNTLSNNLPQTVPSCTHYIYKVDEIVSEANIIKLLEPSLFGYCYFDGEYHLPIVISYYLGLVFVTVFHDANLIFIDTPKKAFKRKYCLSKIIREITCKEIKEEAIQMATMYRENMTPALQEKINKYHNKL